MTGPPSYTVGVDVGTLSGVLAGRSASPPSDRAPAPGPAIPAAVAAGAYPGVAAAAEAVGRVEAADGYDRLYAEHALRHDHFGLGADKALHRLRRIRNEALDLREGNS